MALGILMAIIPSYTILTLATHKYGTSFFVRVCVLQFLLSVFYNCHCRGVSHPWLILLHDAFFKKLISCMIVFMISFSASSLLVYNKTASGSGIVVQQLRNRLGHPHPILDCLV